MDWNTIISAKRTGDESDEEPSRTGYQRDYDRLIFSSAFRRLQDKTQIFPLPGTVFLHNRLTHSLEVASVGRSLGKLAGEKLLGQGKVKEENKDFYKSELQNVIAAACLGHDIGNPPFGHSGEKAISFYFEENAEHIIEGNKSLKSYFSYNQWKDLVNFEGNANSFRVLTQDFNGKSSGGYRLTYSTLASLIKYPCVSEATDRNLINRKKFGFFQSETDLARDIYEALHIDKVSNEPVIYQRHPFVYLTEAADDICYRIVDVEDAHRLHILSHDFVVEKFLKLLSDFDIDINNVQKTLATLDDENEKIAYLRAKSIYALTIASSAVFSEYSDSLLDGSFNYGLVDFLQKQYPVLKEIADFSVDKIYNHDTVLQLEIAGYRVMSDLLSLFIPAVLKEKPGHRDKKILRLIPEQFSSKTSEPYNKVFSVLDFLSGMTDPYIIQLYRRLFGIEIPLHH
ncbi:MAG TPA: dNTP triphosphohydrolase [Bacteroidales bacterium]|nr:dNTP triphosphohydrolase [Bacteroidales bacterium]